MSVDYIVASLPPLDFDGPAPMTRERFDEIVRGVDLSGVAGKWRDLETQMRNAIAVARGGAKWQRPAKGCSVYWRGRAAAAFAEKSPMARENALDRMWWDAAGEMTPPESPLSKGALFTYSVRLDVVLRRNRIARDSGREIVGQLVS